jgi:hypothetical protein
MGRVNLLAIAASLLSIVARPAMAGSTTTAAAIFRTARREWCMSLSTLS